MKLCQKGYERVELGPLPTTYYLLVVSTGTYPPGGAWVQVARETARSRKWIPNFLQPFKALQAGEEGKEKGERWAQPHS